jgi:hypothetical protein
MFDRSFTLCTEGNKENPAAGNPAMKLLSMDTACCRYKHISHRIQQLWVQLLVDLRLNLSVYRPRSEETTLLLDKACSPLEKLPRAHEPFGKPR